MISKKRYGDFIVNYRTNTSDEFVLSDSFDNDIFFRNTPEYLPKITDTIIDVGAHIGTFSMLSAKIVPKGHVFAFEPSSETFEVLERNILDNKCTNVSVFKVALSNSNGTAALYHDIEHGNWGHTLTKAISDVQEEVSTTTLENFINENNISRCNLIKFNCEGSEFEILLNTPEYILDKIESMIILYHEDLVDKKVEDLISFLKRSNFRIKVRNKEDMRGWIIAYKPLRDKLLFVTWIKCYRFLIKQPLYLKMYLARLFKNKD